MRKLARALALPLPLILAISVAWADEIASLKDGKLTVGPGKAVEVSGSGLTWAPDGRHLMVRTGSTFALVDARSLAVVKLSDISEFRFSADGQSILVGTASGRLEIRSTSRLGEVGREVAKTYRPGSLAWSHDGRSVVFARQKDLLQWTLSTGREKRLVTGKAIVASACSPDGRLVAAADDTGTIYAMRPNGTALTAVGKSEAVALTWSPNNRFLLCQTKSGFEVLNPAQQSTEPIVCDALTSPTWTVGQRLVVADHGKGRKLYWEQRDRDADLKVSIPEGVSFWAFKPNNEVGNDSMVPDVFATAPRPNPGQIRVEGYVESADPEDRSYVLAVESWTDRSGRKTMLGDSQTLNVKMADSAQQFDGTNARRMLPSDLKEGDRVSALVAGDRFRPAETPALQQAWIEGAGVIGGGKTESFDAPATTSYPLSGTVPHITQPVIDSKGHTREKLVVPMVFPVAGATHFTDEFLQPWGDHLHEGIDVFAAHNTPLVATFDGVVRIGRGNRSGNYVYVVGDNGWESAYFHLNDDVTDSTPTFGPGIQNGARVTAGQVIGYVGDSGNAKGKGHHCHFELHDRTKRAIVNPYPSLMASKGSKLPPRIVPPIESRHTPRTNPRPSAPRSVEANVSRWRYLYEPLAKEAGLDPELIAAIIQIESSGNPNDDNGIAMGLMQLTKDDCQTWGVANPFDPEQNIRGGIAQLKDYLRMFKGDLTKSLIAYNCGPAHVKKGDWMKFPNTVKYVPSIKKYYAFNGDSPVESPEPSRPPQLAPDGSRTDSPIVFLPPVSEPTPVQEKAQLDEMAAYLKKQYPAMIIDPRLTKVAKSTVRLMVDGEGIEATKAVGKLTAMKAGFLRTEVYAFTTARKQSFAERWPSIQAKGGLKAGLGVAWVGDRPYWCVIVVPRG